MDDNFVFDEGRSLREWAEKQEHLRVSEIWSVQNDWFEWSAESALDSSVQKNQQESLIFPIY